MPITFAGGTPIRGHCLPLCWYGNAGTTSCAFGSTILPRPLTISTSGSLDSIAINFAGRGKVGGSCGGVDTYVSVLAQHIIELDVWRAYADLVWSGSVTIAVFASLGQASPTFNLAVDARVNSGQTTGDCPSAVGTPSTSPPRGESCPTRQVGTVTVFDNGSYQSTMH
jgi:hypothetical protein